LGGVYGGSANGTYGDAANPTEVGSGGGADSTRTTSFPGGNGGGVARITAGLLALEGSIRADGSSGSWDSNYSSGGSGGSGGSIRIDALTVSGAGYIYARGGAGPNRAGGGGGRVGSMTLPAANVVVSAGSGARVGSVGTTYFH